MPPSSKQKKPQTYNIVFGFGNIWASCHTIYSKIKKQESTAVILFPSIFFLGLTKIMLNRKNVPRNCPLSCTKWYSTFFKKVEGI